MKTVNEKGLARITEILSHNHRQKEFTEEMIFAWATEVENHEADGNGAYFEIHANDAVSGHTREWYLDDSMLDDWQ